jgi:hypothetical protein
MEKNYSKYSSYRSAMEQINAAISSGFFLEAITIEESILTDRLLRFCRDQGFTGSADRITLGRELPFIRNNIQLMSEYGFTYYEELNLFWMNRNKCLHQIAKSEPGESTQDFAEMYILAEQTAKIGKLLVKEIGNWAARYKKMQINNK